MRGAEGRFMAEKWLAQTREEKMNASSGPLQVHQTMQVSPKCPQSPYGTARSKSQEPIDLLAPQGNDNQVAAYLQLPYDPDNFVRTPCRNYTPGYGKNGANCRLSHDLNPCGSLGMDVFNDTYPIRQILGPNPSPALIVIYTRLSVIQGVNNP